MPVAKFIFRLELGKIIYSVTTCRNKGEYSLYEILKRRKSKINLKTRRNGLEKTWPEGLQF